MEFLVAESVTSSVRVGSASVAGVGRAVNQDSLLAGPTWFAVADGVGGHGSGEVASALAVDLLAATPEPSIEVDVRAAVHEINQAVRERALDHRTAGMATTIVGVVTVGGRVVVFHLGDSRCYQLIDDEAVAVTRDHSYVQELIDAGMLTADSARSDRRRNVITRALGVEARCSPEIAIVDPTPSRMLLCSDGVSSALSSAAIGDYLKIAEPAAAAESLVRAAVEAGSRDDATAMVIDGLGAA